jgi:hypothetical protein
MPQLACLNRAWIVRGVDDVDVCARRVKNSAAQSIGGSKDILDVGRFAVAGDPQGAGLMLIEPNGDQQPARLLPSTVMGLSLSGPVVKPLMPAVR